MRSTSNHREGMALAAAIGAIVVIGALIAGAFYTSTQEYRIGRNSLTQQRSFVNAEFALNEVLAYWNKANNQMDLRATSSSMRRWNNNRDSALVSITRTNEYTFLVSARGFAGGGPSLSERATSRIYRMAIPTIGVQGALTTKGGVTVTGNSRVSGLGKAPAGWDCADIVNDSLAGIAATHDSLIKVGGSASLEGKPPKQTNAAAGNDSTYRYFGDLTWDELVARADLKLEPFMTNLSPGPTPEDATGPTCTTTQVVGGVTSKILSNWGDPRTATDSIGPCQDYFPVIYSATDLDLSTGTGQGILLVNGDLSIQGNFTFFGVVIVTGELSILGTGQNEGKIIGSVMAAGATIGKDQNTVSGNANIQYSNCALQTALRGSADITPARERAWAEMF